MKNFYKLIISILIPMAVGGIAGFSTVNSVKGWYLTLNKPSFNPPSWLFGPVWTVLYIMMGIAFYIIWKSNTAKDLKKKCINIYFIQLAFNFLWSFLFFKLENPALAFVDITIMLVTISKTIFYFKKVSISAAWLLVPYLCWVSFATVLNFAIWQLN